MIDDVGEPDEDSNQTVNNVNILYSCSKYDSNRVMVKVISHLTIFVLFWHGVVVATW